ncbi:hypothetical protein A2631_04545 [Candidatus Daviesbacteria bacterium RIFCSPHIGHO2_01_FULL_44_29]|uniref:Uncharacterized protein n=1 Tax=Candidatus Daviesbacteria bacterium RIFCSPHIGHO2_02_FULL_43_12 TaxID=1797776 RepID=A0A1F5KGP9_9BACT|nr:MAG: hypothetical protein A2631_04545 [Candidatus Daviesbacteria bacterium RIFCSPHIGHO2_01_FULL_44_29]OGE39608.1 MAG: hypothetical protein A3E86_05700 [Candidatus Daviesbacteria bacterium RIFCSPHIGHO2_12_FULL_47_45]OGE39990.1 MAG: hypothetical protein A3D25_04275 [Candidatus Daviesbacteria bacterium RIFCSPHIGHO2_02_FULL_43_12]OGE70329.1 MAG: hypothetical protein A3B55_01295 [Candidatus Daviesbacteria bacterium RIFCSPLOWO2_01_FULL_43_15]
MRYLAETPTGFVDIAPAHSDQKTTIHMPSLATSTLLSHVPEPCWQTAARLYRRSERILDNLSKHPTPFLFGVLAGIEMTTNLITQRYETLFREAVSLAVAVGAYKLYRSAQRIKFPIHSDPTSPR